MKSHSTFAAWIALVAVMAAGTAGAAEQPDVQTIVEKANRAAYYAGDDGRAHVSMTIKAPDGGTRTREFVVLRMNTGDGGQKFYVYFTEPADVRRMAYLVWKHADKDDDDRWLRIPALDLVKRIAPGDKRTSFVGSDFVYEDVSGRRLDQDTHELIETTDEFYKVRNTPKDPESVEFAYYDVWIDKETFLPRRAEYVDKNGRHYRTVEATKVESIQGHPTVVESVARDLSTGSSTTNVFSKVEYGIGLNERIFTERFLQRPPREVR